MATNPIQQNPPGAYVYAIVVDGVVRYIGKGRNGRHKEHLRRARFWATSTKSGAQAKRKLTQFQKKLLSAYDAGAKIEYEILISGLSDHDAYESERMSVAHEPLGNLWNIDIGGHGPTSEGMRRALSDPEIRKRISIGTKLGLSDPEIRAKRRMAQLEAASKPETREKKSAASRRNLSDLAYRSRFAARMADPEVRKKMSVAAKKRGTRPNFVESMRAAQKEKYGTERRSETMRRALSDPTIKAKLSQASKRKWQDPVWREKLLRIRKECRTKCQT